MTSSNNELRNAIAAANRNQMDTFGRGDAEGMAKLYTATGQLLPTNSDFVTGGQAIQEFFQGGMDVGIKTIELETVELEGDGDTAIEVGRGTLRGEAGQVLDKQKYVLIWKREGGQWKLHRVIWNTSMPATA